MGASREFLPVTVDAYNDGNGDGYTFTCESIQVNLPPNSYYSAFATDVMDAVIFIAIADWSQHIQDQDISTRLKNVALSGLETVTQHMAGSVVSKS